MGNHKPDNNNHIVEIRFWSALSGKEIQAVPGIQEYMKETNAFVPWFSRKKS